MAGNRALSRTEILVAVLAVLFVLFLVLRIGIPLWNELVVSVPG